MCPTTFTLNDKKTLQKLRKISQKLPNCPAMLNIREILGQKIAEPMQSPLTPICPGATLHRELDAQKKRKNLSKLYFVPYEEYICFLWRIYLFLRLNVFMFLMLIIQPAGGEVSHGIKKWKLVPTSPNHSHKPRWNF